MTTIYKTTFRVGRRAICTLPITKAQALERIKQVADDMGWQYTANQYSVAIHFAQAGDRATYTIEENNC